MIYYYVWLISSVEVLPEFSLTEKKWVPDSVVYNTLYLETNQTYLLKGLLE